MSEVIQCKSCGSSNQLPDGRNSMFCAFCGSVIEKKVIYEPQQNKVFPKIISKGKRELPFKETKWYKDKMSANSFAVEQILKNKIDRDIYEMTKKYGSMNYIFNNIEGYRTNDGYNAIIIYEPSNSFSDDRKETEFVPFEYDYSEYESKLDLSSMNIKSFNDILSHYDLSDIHELTSLNLDNNQITNWDGILEFKILSKLSLANNYIESYPEKLPKMDFYVSLIHIDLSNNKLTSFPEKIEKFDYKKTTINLNDNPIDWNSVPTEIGSCHVLDNGSFAKWRFKLHIDENKILTFDYIETPEDKKRLDELKEEKLKEQKNSSGEGKCFIATATMGSYNHPEVMELRQFRDNWILRQSWGENFVKWYYHYGEKLAKVIEPNSFLKKISYYTIVKPLVIISRIFLK